ncbi:MAG: hypothetical protein ACOC6F_01330, partial [bacterium]
MKSLTQALAKAVPRRLWRGALIGVVLLGAAYLGLRPSRRWLMLLAAGIGLVAALARPVLALFG